MRLHPVAGRTAHSAIGTDGARIALADCSASRVGSISLTRPCPTRPSSPYSQSTVHSTTLAQHQCSGSMITPIASVRRWRRIHLTHRQCCCSVPCALQIGPVRQPGGRRLLRATGAAAAGARPAAGQHAVVIAAGRRRRSAARPAVAAGRVPAHHPLALLSGADQPPVDSGAGRGPRRGGCLCRCDCGRRPVPSARRARRARRHGAQGDPAGSQRRRTIQLLPVRRATKLLQTIGER